MEESYLSLERAFDGLGPLVSEQEKLERELCSKFQEVINSTGNGETTQKQLEYLIVHSELLVRLFFSDENEKWLISKLKALTPLKEVPQHRRLL